MEEHILNLLKSSNKVIIPEFGAFIVKQSNPRIIIFNEFLQYNDGLLQAEIKKEEKIDDEAIKNKINRFIDDMKLKLDKEGEAMLKGLGFLSKSASGKITLKESGKKEVPKQIKTKEPEEEIPKEPVKKAPVSKKTETKKEEIKKTEPVKETTSEPIELSAEEKITPSETKPVAKEEVQKSAPKKAETENVVKKEEKPTYKYTSSSYTSKVDKKEDEDSGKPVFVSGKKKKRSASSTIFWIFFILLINGAILSYLFIPQVQDTINQFFNKDSDVQVEETDEETVDQIISELEAQIDEELRLEEEQKKAEMKTEEKAPLQQTIKKPVERRPAAISSGERFYIVAGCFSNEGNADNLVNELAKKGYNAEKFGRIGSLHAVSYASFDDEYTARQELSRYKTDVSADVWLVQY